MLLQTTKATTAISVDSSRGSLPAWDERGACGSKKRASDGSRALLLLAYLGLGSACVDLDKPWDKDPPGFRGTGGATTSVPPGEGGSIPATTGSGGIVGTGGVPGAGGRGGGTGGDGGRADGAAARDGSTSVNTTGGVTGAGGNTDFDAPEATGGVVGTGGEADWDAPNGGGGSTGQADGQGADGDESEGGVADAIATDTDARVADGGGPATGGVVGTGGVGGAGGATASGGTSSGGSTSVVYNCASGAVVPASGTVTSFSDWNEATETWGPSTGLHGEIFSYAGSNATFELPKVEGAPKGLHLKGTVTAASGYGGGGVLFWVCAKVSTFTQIQFDIYGSGTGCAVQMQIPVYDQRPTTQDPPGGCLPPDGSTPETGCYKNPAMSAVVDLSTAIPSTSPRTVQKDLADFADWSTANADQVIGVQWQFTRSGSANCTADLTITNIKFL